MIAPEQPDQDEDGELTYPQRSARAHSCSIAREGRPFNLPTLAHICSRRHMNSILFSKCCCLVPSSATIVKKALICILFTSYASCGSKHIERCALTLPPLCSCRGRRLAQVEAHRIRDPRTIPMRGYGRRVGLALLGSREQRRVAERVEGERARERPPLGLHHGVSEPGERACRVALWRRRERRHRRPLPVALLAPLFAPLVAPLFAPLFALDAR